MIWLIKKKPRSCEHLRGFLSSVFFLPLGQTKLTRFYRLVTSSFQASSARINNRRIERFHTSVFDSVMFPTVFFALVFLGPLCFLFSAVLWPNVKWQIAWLKWLHLPALMSRRPGCSCLLSDYCRLTLSVSRPCIPRPHPGHTSWFEVSMNVLKQSCHCYLAFAAHCCLPNLSAWKLLTLISILKKCLKGTEQRTNSMWLHYLEVDIIKFYSLRIRPKMAKTKLLFLTIQRLH